MGHIITPGARQLKVVHEPPPGPSIGEELGLERLDVIEIDQVHDATVAANYRLRSGTKCLIVPNDEYFEALEIDRERESMMVGDPKHLIAVAMVAPGVQEPFGLMVLRNKQVSWRKVGRVRDIRWTSV